MTAFYCYSQHTQPGPTSVYRVIMVENEIVCGEVPQHPFSHDIQ